MTNISVEQLYIYNKYRITKYDFDRPKDSNNKQNVQMRQKQAKIYKKKQKNRILTGPVRQLRKNTKKLTYKERMLTFIQI